MFLFIKEREIKKKQTLHILYFLNYFQCVCIVDEFSWVFDHISTSNIQIKTIFLTNSDNSVHKFVGYNHYKYYIILRCSYNDELIENIQQGCNVYRVVKLIFLYIVFISIPKVEIGVKNHE